MIVHYHHWRRLLVIALLQGNTMRQQQLVRAQQLLVMLRRQAVGQTMQVILTLMSVNLVADDGVAQMRQMRADLMLAPGD